MHTSVLDRKTFVKKIPEFITLFDKNPSMTIRIEYDTPTPQKGISLEQEYDQAIIDVASGKKRILFSV